ncbi:hypothetical protein LZ554_007162 [Drepanopeziza brunnea f. sp. 'monogermtubi']|nr:hypothetical protein LZ554_007162 [Drepanopeziza brunnea f. sp. 'monogermtubi']
MATVHGPVASKKKIMTYGKAARKRIPEHGFTSKARKSQTPDRETEIPRNEVTRGASSTLLPLRTPTPPKAKPVRPRSRSRTPCARRQVDIFDAPESDDEAPAPKAHKTTTSTNMKQMPAPFRSHSRTHSTISPSNDIFDVPCAEDDAPVLRPIRKPVSRAAATPPMKLKSILRRSPSKTPSPPAPAKDIYEILSDIEDEAPKPVQKIAKAIKSKEQKVFSVCSISAPAVTPKKDIFDFPSGDEGTPTTKSIFKVSKTIPPNGDAKLIHKPPTGGQGVRKKLKLSPVEPQFKRLPANNPRPVPGSRIAKPRPRNISPKGNLTKSVARTKVKVSTEKEIEAPKTPSRLSLTLEPTTPPVSLSDVHMADVDPSGRHISPHSMKMWQNLLGSDDNGESSTGADGDTTEVDGGTIVPTKAAKSETRVRSLLLRPAGISKPARKNAPDPPRRRLIDSLVEQAVHSSGDHSDDSDEISALELSDGMDTIMQDASNSENTLASSFSESQPSQTMGPKFTYAKQRSMLNEEDLMAQLSIEIPAMPAQTGGRRGRTIAIPSLKQLSSFKEDEDEESVAAIRSVHELRQAGANNRFLDEVQDYLERIGSPGKSSVSMRRSGLLDLASKMQNKNFLRQFRQHGTEQKLFMHLGKETEIVSGFLMVTILISLLLDGNMPHIVGHLRRQGITRLLIRQLECQSGIVAVAKARESNMSKVAITLVSEYQDYLVKLPSPAWDEVQLQSLSPRTAALRCLELIVRQTREAGSMNDLFSKELTANLFAIVNTATDRSWNLPKEEAAIDFYFALSALDLHSIGARTASDETIWTKEFLPIVSKTLQAGMARPLEEFGILQSLILKLTLNVTNNNPRASDVFAQPPLMAAMGQVAVTRLDQISRFMIEDELSVAVDYLVLVLGVMINFAEWSPACRQSLQSLQGSDGDPLDAMVAAFSHSLERTSQADSVHETQKNVAFGYLSVLLGFLSQLPALCDRIAAKQPRKSLKTVISAIEEFVGHFKVVDLIAVDEEGYNPQHGLTERLEKLVGSLKALKK